jgi:hypothetical protein
MDTLKTDIPSDLTPVPRVFDREFSDVYYSKSKNQFYTRNKRFKQPSIHDLRPILWNKINLNYTNKKGENKIYSYRYASLPFQSSYIRLKESEWLKSQKCE